VGDGGVSVDDEVASLKVAADGNAAHREQVVGVWVQVTVLLVVSVFSLIDADVAILPDVDQGSVWADHPVPDLLNPSAVPGSKWCVQSLLLSLAVRVSVEFPPCGPDLLG
jgi:hypothetical protein